MKVRIVLIAVIAFLGMVDTIYLSLKRNAGPIPCHVTQGCNDVLTSRYSAPAGIPLSWLGFGFYITVFSLAVLKLSEDPKQPANYALSLIFYLAGLGLVVSALLTGVQAFILKAFCEYCLLSALFVLAIFLLAPRPELRTQNP
jgi:uncharacterized membrane protein